MNNHPQAEPRLARTRARNPLPRLALTKPEAAESIGMSVDSLERHVLPEIRVVREGRLVLIPVRQLERWLDQHASRVGDDFQARGA